MSDHQADDGKVNLASIAGLIPAIDDVDSWEELGVMVGSDGPLCPWCERRFSHQFAGANGKGHCQHCGKPFVWMANHTGLGFQWSTMRAGIVRKPEGGKS